MSRLYEDRAWLYDAAFSWDIEDEVTWLLERFGGSVKRILEPGCGSGRLMAALSRRGIEVTGVDRSQTMLDRARRRMEALGLPAPRLERGDMATFELGTRFDGAVLPINTFGYIRTYDEARGHLACVAAHLPPKARYMIQLDLKSLDAAYPGPESSWEVEAPEGRIRCTWGAQRLDPNRMIETQVSKFEILSGPEAGTVYEDEHCVRPWSWSDWEALIDVSAFVQVAAYAGTGETWDALDFGPGLDGRPLTWHELVRG